MVSTGPSLLNNNLKKKINAKLFARTIAKTVITLELTSYLEKIKKLVSFLITSMSIIEASIKKFVSLKKI